DFVLDVARAEHAGGEADEGRQHDEHLVEVVDQKIFAGRWLDREQRQRREEGQQRRQYVEPRGQLVAGEYGKDRGGDRRDQQDRSERVEGHRRSPRKRSSACRSTLSKRSRMRNRKMPITMKAISTENATEISTTSGMPLAPVAASTRPFSSDMKPTTWLTALRRVTMTSRPSNTTDNAKARSSRASGSAPGVTRSITTIDSATRPMPASIVSPKPIAVSISRWMPSRTMIRCSATGMMMALNTSAISAVM